MLKNKIEKKGPSDYIEPFEFRLLIGDSIICQRYFRINNFNPNSLTSMELTNTIRACAQMINEDLKSKSRIYTWYMAPYVFENEEEMIEWFANPANTSRLSQYENITLKDTTTEYIWDGEQLIKCEKQSEDSTFTAPLTERDMLTYEFAFFVNGKKIVSSIFEGIYPHFIRRNIDLSNLRGKFEGEDITRLGAESYLLNRLVCDRPDLIKKIVRDICYVCAVSDNDYYTQIETYKQSNGTKVTYPLNIDPTNTVLPKPFFKKKQS